VSEQTAADRKAQADGAAREAAADALALFSGYVGVAELVTGKAGTAALDQLVRQRALTPDEAARIWRRSGRQDAPAAPEMTLQQYRQQFGYRRPQEIDNSGPRPVGRSVAFDPDDARKRAAAVAEDRRYHREIAERGQLRPEVASFRRRNRLDRSVVPGTDFAVQEGSVLP
jgi:hypothetical protein